MNVAARPLLATFSRVTSWIFDLDNTLYPSDSSLWPQIEDRITSYLIAHSGLDGASAQALQRYYYHQYGTTLRGLVEESDVDPEDFMSFVHDIDRTDLALNPALAREIAALPGRKLIFTNGSRQHALDTILAVGLTGLFEGVFDVVDAGLIPKPRAEAYDAFLKAHGVDPAHAAMFEDIAKNLAVPRALGMATVLVTGKPGHIDHRQPKDREGAPEFVDFVTDDLAAFLARVNAELSAL